MKIICDQCQADCTGDFWQRTERAMRLAPDGALRVEYLQGYVSPHLCPDCQAAEPTKREG